MKYPEFWISASSKQKRIYSTLFVLGLAVIATLAGTLVQLNPEQAQDIYNQLNQTTRSPTLLTDIFVNNFPLCLLMFIPLAGLGIGLFILFSTGIAFRAAFDVQAASGFEGSASISSIDPATAILVVVLAGVVFVVEYVSYSIAMTESVWMFRRLLQRRWKELKVLTKLIGVVAVLLAIGAVVEWAAITIGI